MQDASSLNERFGISALVQFSDAGAGLPVLEIASAFATARIALQGAHVLAWQPVGHDPVIWVSKAAVYQPGKAVRGGVPICWPWFGPKAGHAAHGFVRTRMWTLRETRLEPTGEVVVRLGTTDDDSTRAIWNHAFDLELTITVGSRLIMQLRSRNTGDRPFELTEALHTYFNVADIQQAAVLGLDGIEYQNKVEPFGVERQKGEVLFSGETDRVYVNTTDDCLIHDRQSGRVIRVAKAGSAATVVWNPWSEKEKSFADMATGEYRGMVCVESANTGTEPVLVPAGGEHVLLVVLSIE
jgi:glucose-6-phosphate 1-epimerase